jgi:hypothetical protein
MEVGGERHALAALSLGKRRGTHCTEVGWASGPVETGVEKRKSIIPHRGSSPEPSSPVASRYTDYAILAPYVTQGCHNDCAGPVLPFVFPIDP